MRVLSITAAAVTLAISSMASAVTLTSFDTFTPDGPYAAWASGTITSGATALQVQATGFGGAYCNLPNADATGADTIQLNFTVNAGVAGVIVALGDTTGHEWNYAWYGNPAGSYVLTKPIATPNFSTGAAGQLDLANIDYMHIQIDPGMFAAVPYDVSYNDLQLVTVPEPTTLAALAFGGLLMRRRR